ncbi:MAG: bifunctional (p)ppGpp synthetase/guanosine-3',5'-bis(diphosphate) 3'-pyrophosphohydrolase [Alphaproteobacteria bacterium]|nr:MAG: bifunctional (p)ppGpp synthetase/guanosine-3',5'-bis(diphosphate) 3'-pyrophosphohydrolase [Alphaproteobacteria bacterium]
MIRQYELVERVKSYDPNADEDALNRAYVFSLRAHGSQKRASGDPYFSHPLEVAAILTDMKLDAASIITALLHDTVEDTQTSLEDIQKLFGEEIARLVDGVTKLSKIELQNVQNKQAENFRKLVIAMSEDIRVLLVKLADRAHNMRTLHFFKDPEKRRRIALETLEIYAPLAERIGMQSVKDELEDLAFAELYPDARDSLIARLNFLRAKGDNVIGRIIDELKELFNAGGIPCHISGREKTPYSIWRKMQRRNVEFEQLADIMAFRVIVDNIEQCYQCLGMVHSQYPVVPGRFKDYISTPKPNGYKSLHTAVIGPEKERIEIQIRTHEMHEISEMGVAAHWNYKQGEGLKEGKHFRWLRQLLEILEQAESPEEFLEHTKLEMYQDQVFCFSPKGDLVALPRGATPVDFAYEVHSAVGDACVGAKINGRIMPLRTLLKNGDQVEIITSKSQTPSPTWEEFVVTGKAKSHIRKFVRSQKRAQYLNLGKQIMQKAFRHENKPLNDKLVEGVIKKFNATNVDDVYALVGEGIHTAKEVLLSIYPEEKTANQPLPTPQNMIKPAKIAKSSHSLPIKGLIPGMALHFAKCCHPLPGDRIVGIVTTGKGVSIHTSDCDVLQNFADQPERWLDVGWDNDHMEGEKHVSRMMVVIANEPGSLGSLSTVIGKCQGNITNLRITSRSTEFFEIIVDVEVKDLTHLTEIMAALRATSVINSVERISS